MMRMAGLISFIFLSSSCEAQGYCGFSLNRPFFHCDRLAAFGCKWLFVSPLGRVCVSCLLGWMVLL